MQLPPEYVRHLDHRITVLLSFTVRRDAGWFGRDHGEQKGLGDAFRASLEGAGIMLRMLMEFLGVKADRQNPTIFVASSQSDARLGVGLLQSIDPIAPGSIGNPMEQFLAGMHDQASKRT